MPSLRMLGEFRSGYALGVDPLRRPVDEPSGVRPWAMVSPACGAFRGGVMTPTLGTGTGLPPAAPFAPPGGGLLLQAWEDEVGPCHTVRQAPPPNDILDAGHFTSSSSACKRALKSASMLICNSVTVFSVFESPDCCPRAALISLSSSCNLAMAASCLMSTSVNLSGRSDSVGATVEDVSSTNDSRELLYFMEDDDISLEICPSLDDRSDGVQGGSLLGVHIENSSTIRLLSMWPWQPAEVPPRAKTMDSGLAAAPSSSLGTSMTAEHTEPPPTGDATSIPRRRAGTT